ncbi:MAG: RimK/LysX family protein [Chitinophagales bacterium]
MKEKNKPHIIGRNDIIDLPDLGLYDLPAKVDTGAYTSALSYKNWEIKDGELHIVFEVEKGKTSTFKTREYYQKVIRNSFGQAEKRYIIKTTVKIFGDNYPTEFSLSKRKALRFPVLLGRKFLKENFMVDVNRYKLSYKKKMRIS